MTQLGSAPERASFLERQLQFAAHIRDPERVPRPQDVDARRMNVYCELFYNNIEGLLANTFPVLREITEERRWHNLVRDFFARHRAETPRFLELSREFLFFLEHERAPDRADPPFLLELAHYEWVELELGVAEADVRFNTVDPRDLSQGSLTLSPLARNLSYRFPVHRVSAQWAPDGEAPTHLLVCRDRDDEIGFLELNAVSARLIALIAGHPCEAARNVLEQIAAEIAHPEPEQVVRAGLEVLHDLVWRDIVIVTE